MKRKVHYAILEDMEKYLDDFNPKDYEKTINETDDYVIEMMKKYYDTHLPVDLTAWKRVHDVPETRIWRDQFHNQMHFIGYIIDALIRKDYEDFKDNSVMVISTHRSKSIDLPVYQIDLEKYGVEMILRDNYYNWKVSVNSKKPLDCDFMGIFDPDEKWSSLYCEGFPYDKVYGSYNENHSQFTVELTSKYDLYTFFIILKNYLGIKRKK